MFEDDPYIRAALRQALLDGYDERYHNAMEAAQTLEDWTVIAQELVVGFRCGRDQPQGLRPYVLKRFLSECPMEEPIVLLRSALLRVEEGRYLLGSVSPRVQRGRDDWREYKKSLLPSSVPLGTLGSSLREEVRSKLLALRESLQTTQTA